MLIYSLNLFLKQGLSFYVEDLEFASTKLRKSVEF